MLTDEETDPKTRKAKPRNLERFSVPELKDYIEQLQDEITRVAGEIAKKEKSHAAADAVFGNKPEE